MFNALQPIYSCGHACDVPNGSVIVLPYISVTSNGGKTACCISNTLRDRFREIVIWHRQLEKR